MFLSAFNEPPGIFRGAGGSGGKGGNENACPNFSGRQASVLGEQNGKWGRWGKTKWKKGPPPGKFSGGPFNNAI